MCKELYIEAHEQAHEYAVEDIMDVMGLERDEALREIDSILESDPSYLDNYYFTLCEASTN